MKTKCEGEAASANQEAADEFQDTVKKIIEEKGYLLKRFLMQTQVPYSGGEKATGNIS